MSSQFINNHHKQAGAIGLWGVLTLMMAVLFMALAVDTGRLYLQKRKLQSVTDMAAISAAQRIGCFPEVGAAAEAAQAIATQNGFEGTFEIVELGSVNKVNGINHFAPTGQQAVRVVATQSVPASLIAGGLFQGHTILQAEAVSEAAAPTAAFTIGSTLVNLSTSDAALLNNFLGELLGSHVNLSVASYQGLAFAHVTLQDLLKVQGQVGSLDKLLKDSMPLEQMLTMLANAIELEGRNSQIASTLQQLANAASNGGSARLADVLAITSSAEAASTMKMNVLGLVNALAIAAHGTNAISIHLSVSSDLSKVLPSLSVLPTIIPVPVDVSLQFLQPPQLGNGHAGGCTFARTAQIEARVTVKGPIPSLIDFDIQLKLSVAQGEAVLETISDDGSNTNVVIDTNSGIASLAITDSTGLGNGSIMLLGLRVPISSTPTSQASTANRMVFDVPHPVSQTLPLVERASNTAEANVENLLNQSSSLNIEGLVSEVVRPLLVTVAKSLLDPLLQMLGIKLGIVDVTLHDVKLRSSQALAI